MAVVAATLNRDTRQRLPQLLVYPSSSVKFAFAPLCTLIRFNLVHRRRRSWPRVDVFDVCRAGRRYTPPSLTPMHFTTVFLCITVRPQENRTVIFIWPVPSHVFFVSSRILVGFCKSFTQCVSLRRYVSLWPCLCSFLYLHLRADEYTRACTPLCMYSHTCVITCACFELMFFF